MEYEIIFTLSLAYLLGSIPFGYIFTKLYGFGDLRTKGSGNIGATNALRVGGRKLAIFTLLADAAKGLAAIWLGRIAYAHGAPLPWPIETDFIIMLHGALAILGHIFPIFLKFHGGKGVSTFIGALAAFSPALALIFIACWLIIAFISRYSSLAALISIWICCDIIAIKYTNLPISILFMLIAVLISYCHRENIKRLIAGCENKIGAKKHDSQ